MLRSPCRRRREELSAEDLAAVLAAPDTVKMIEAKLADLAYTMVMGILRPKQK